MALVVEDGSGLANADSYISLADAEAYVSSMGQSLTGSATEKEAALRRATVWIDGRYRDCLTGYRLNGRDQSLEWPRTGAQDTSGNILDSDAVPSEIANATAQAAVVEASSSGSLSPQSTGEKTLTRVGELQWTPNSGAGSAEAVRPVLTVVNDILSAIFDIKGAASGSTTRTTATRVLRG